MYRCFTLPRSYQLVLIGIALTVLTVTFLFRFNHQTANAAPEAASLLITKSVYNTTPTAGQPFTYLIRYRCASITQHCYNAQITDAIPSSLTIVSYTGAGGNVAAANEAGNTLTWDMASPAGTLGAPEGALAAGSAGLLKVTVRFPRCGTQDPAAGVSVDNSADFNATLGGSPASATSGTASVTAPTIPTCPDPPAASTDLSKTLLSDLVQPGGVARFRINFPYGVSAPSTTWTLTETIPANFYLTHGWIFSGSGWSWEFQCPGSDTFYEVDDSNVNDWVNANNPTDADTVPTMLDRFGNPTGCSAWRIAPYAPSFAVDATKVRWTIPPNQTDASQISLGFLVDDNIALGEHRNCVDTDVSGWGEQCVDIPVIESSVPTLRPDKNLIYNPGQSTLPPSYAGSGLSHTPSDMIWELLAINPHESGVDVVSPIIEDYLPVSLDYVEGENWWGVTIEDRPNLADAIDPYNQPACQNPIFTITEYEDDVVDATGTTRPGPSKLLRWEFPGCVLPHGQYDEETRVSIYLQTRLKPGYNSQSDNNDVTNRIVTRIQDSQLYCAHGPLASTTGDQHLVIDDACIDWGWNYRSVIPTISDFNASKWVQGSLDATYHRYPNSGNTDLNGTGTYEIYLQNTGNVTHTVIDIVDILPHVGDTALVTGAARDSSWSQELVSDITIEHYNAISDTWTAVPPSELYNSGILYAAGINPCRENGSGVIKVDGANPASCETLSTATSAVGARSFGFRWTPSAPFSANDQLRITVNVQQLDGEAAASSGDIAWNSFAYTATYYDPDLSTQLELPSTEPLKVGLEMIDQSVTAGLGDRVWYDSNGNGIQDADESGIAGVQVSLYTAGGITVTNEIGTPVVVETDSDGNYLFLGLDPSTTYLIRLNNSLDHAAHGPLGQYSLTGANQGGDDALDSDAALNSNGYPEISGTTGAAGTIDRTYDFGFTQLASLGNYVWYDTDSAGDQNEPYGVYSATVQLRTPGVDGVIGGGDDQVISTTVTTASGSYLFENLTPGNYYVAFDFSTITGTHPLSPTQFVSAADWMFTLVNTTGNSQTDSDANTTTGFTQLTYLEPGENDLSWDAGLRPLPAPPSSPVSLGNFVWEDLNNNGRQDAGELGIPNVRVDLLDSSGFPIGTTYTDNDGKYQFINLKDANSYGVLFTPPAGSSLTNANSGTTDADDSDADPTNGSTGTFTIDPDDGGLDFDIEATGTHDPRWDAGITTTLSIGNFVWADSNNDGDYDAGEAALADLEVRLLDSSGTTTIATTKTDSNGKYLFIGLPAGQYLVEVEIPAGMASSTDIMTSSTPNNGTDSDDNGVSLAPGFARANPITLEHGGGSWAEADHGLPINSVSDITLDRNADYTLDFSFTSSSASCVNLFDNGSFENSSGVTHSSTDFGWGSVAAGQLNSGSTSVTNWRSAPSGAISPAAIYTISDTVGTINNPNGDHFIWLPSDGTTNAYERIEQDATSLSSALVVGQQYELCYDAAAGVNAAETILEFYDGGSYTPVYTTTLTASGADTTLAWQQICHTFTYNNDVDRLVFAQRGAEGVAIDNAQLCAVPTSAELGAIGNYIWLDENSDSAQDAGERGLPNVVVNLTDSSGNVYTTTTDTNGGYLFTALPADNYVVSIPALNFAAGGALAGMTQSPIDGHSADFGNKDDAGYAISLGWGEENLTADFGYNVNPSDDVDAPTGSPPAALGDRIWIDSDGDGAQDPDEIGVSGITVTLYHDPDGNGVYDTVYAVTTTDATGYYLFDGLPPAAYVVTVTGSSSASHDVLAGGYTQTGDPDHFGTTGAVNDNTTTTPIVLGPGDVFLNADFGYQPASCLQLGDLIFFDAAANGTFDGSDYGLSGITIALIHDVNGDGIWDANGADNSYGTSDDESIIAQDRTDSSGNYLFSCLLPDDYITWVNDTDNVLHGVNQSALPDNGNNNGQACGTCNGMNAITLAADNLFQDYGYTPSGHASGRGLIGDTIWFDVDGSGTATQDSGEPGIEGVIVTLTDSSGNVITTTTNENGNYWFGNLDPSATYTVTISPANFQTGGVLQGMSETYDPDGGTAGQTTVDLSADLDGIDLDRDFSYRGAAGQLGNLVWLDLNADGDDDSGTAGSGEGPIGNVTLDLYRDLDCSGRVDAGEPIFGRTTTVGTVDAAAHGANGVYDFDNLPVIGPGTGGGSCWVVDVTDQAGTLFGYWKSSGTQGADNHSQADPYGDSGAGSLVLTAGSPTNLTADFGYYVDPAAVGNFVWFDLDYDGVQDSGEPGLDGITVTLVITYPDGTNITLHTVTGDDPSTSGTTEQGWYSFGNLLYDEDYATSSGGTAPSSSPAQPAYVVSMALPTGYSVTIVNAGAAANDQEDADAPSGVAAAATMGSQNTAQNSDPGAESAPIASYDFGLVRIELGDLPNDKYNTLIANSGARHVIWPDIDNDHVPDMLGAIWTGVMVDVETDGHEGGQNGQTTGDDTDGVDDEDGLIIPPQEQLIVGNTVYFSVTLRSRGVQLADYGLWIDWDGDQAFSGENEFLSRNDIAIDQLVSGNIYETNFTLSTTVPSGTVQHPNWIYIRGRVFAANSTTRDVGLPAHNGLASNGEVEDFATRLLSPTAVELASVEQAIVPTHALYLLTIGGLLGLFTLRVVWRQQQNRRIQSLVINHQ